MTLPPPALRGPGTGNRGKRRRAPVSDRPAWRESEVVSGAKDDPGDAEVIAEYLRLRAHKLTVLAPFSDETRALRAVVRARDDLVEHRVAAHNQLEACLDAFWPGAKGVFADVTSEIALAFLERYPTPASARALGERRMAAFLVKHGYSARRPAGELLERLRAAPEGILDGPAEARRDAVLGYVRVIRALNAAVKDLDRSVAAHLGEDPDNEIFTSLPRSGRINAAQMLTEWGDCREAYDGPEAVTALTGAAPVTKKSGKHEAVHFGWACDKRFRQAMTTFADNSWHASPWAADVYQRALARGCDHPHAIRVLARAWIRNHLPVLDRSRRLRPRPTRCRTTACRSHQRQGGEELGCLGLTQRVSCVAHRRDSHPSHRDRDGIHDQQRCASERRE